MNVLVTAARMPFALDEIRKLGQRGHRVFAADSFDSAPGSHSRWVTRAFRVASPRHATSRFLDDLQRIVAREHIDVIVPTFEEVFYLARHAAQLSSACRLLAPPFQEAARLHDKWAFRELARSLGLSTPRTILARTPDELRRACDELGEYFARAIYSRGGLKLLTNRGPLAGRWAFEDCDPTPDRPWLVQEYVTGRDLCTFSVARRGSVAAHVTYVHPLTIEHAGGIALESIVDPEALRIAQRLAEATGYHGQLALDLIENDKGHFLIECNPRATTGVTLMSTDDFVDAVIGTEPVGVPRVTPAGIRRHVTLALLRNMLRDWREIPRSLDELFARGARDIYASDGDLLPAFYVLVSYMRVLAFRSHEGSRKTNAILGSYFDDLQWDGEPIA